MYILYVSHLYTVEIGSFGNWLPNSQRSPDAFFQMILIRDQRKPEPHHVFSSELLRNFIFFIVYFFVFLLIIYIFLFLPFPRTCYLAVVQP